MQLDLDIRYKAVSSNGEEGEFSMGELLSFGKKTILYFYPKDNTAGCTIENQDFSDRIEDFARLWIVVVWVSKDSIDSHQKFIGNYDLKVDLISDSDLQLHKELGAYGEKTIFWKKKEWVIRSTFLLDREWNIQKEWKNVDAKGHVEKVFDEVKMLK